MTPDPTDPYRRGPPRNDTSIDFVDIRIRYTGTRGHMEQVSLDQVAQALSDGLQIKFSDPVLRDRLMETQHRHLEVCKLPQQDKDVLHLDNLFCRTLMNVRSSIQGIQRQHDNIPSTSRSVGLPVASTVRTGCMLRDPVRHPEAQVRSVGQ